MWKFLSRARPRRDDSNTDGNNEEPMYGPECGMSKEEFEWRWKQYKMVRQRWPEVMDELKTHSQRMRQHFLADPDALKKWDEYERDVHSAFAYNLQHSLSSPARLPDAVLYKHLMERKARSKTLVGKLSGGLDMLKQAAKNTRKNKRIVGAGVIAVSVAAGIAIGLAVGPIQSRWNQRKHQQTDEA
ncbi:hypothetical protein ACP70R_026160 [Stipagrostis hirtigluma subsp. patula]